MLEGVAGKMWDGAAGDGLKGEVDKVLKGAERKALEGLTGKVPEEVALDGASGEALDVSGAGWSGIGIHSEQSKGDRPSWRLFRT